MLMYHIKSEDDESIGTAFTIEKAIEIREEKSKSLGKYLHIYEITTWNGWEEKELLTL